MPERKGRTVYLLKQGAKSVPENRKRRKIDVIEFPDGSKPVPQERKRRKVNIVGNPAQWMQHVSEVNSQAPSQAPSAAPSKAKEEVKNDFDNAMQQPQPPSVGKAALMGKPRNRGGSKER